MTKFTTLLFPLSLKCQKCNFKKCSEGTPNIFNWSSLPWKLNTYAGHTCLWVFQLAPLAVPWHFDSFGPIFQEVLHSGKYSPSESLLLAFLEGHKWDLRLFPMATHENPWLPPVAPGNFSLSMLFYPYILSQSPPTLPLHPPAPSLCSCLCSPPPSQLLYFPHLLHSSDSITWNLSMSLAISWEQRESGQSGQNQVTYTLKI